jgi:hypothetical protein
MGEPLNLLEVDLSQYTRKRVMVTTRLPKDNAPGSPTWPWVVLEAEDGSGVAIALMGPDTPATRADAARMMQLWNDSLPAADTND